MADPKHAGTAPKPEMIRHAQALNAMFIGGGILLLFLYFL